MNLLRRAYSQDLVLNTKIIHYFINILRIKEGELIELFDGNGKVLRAKFNFKPDPFLTEMKISESLDNDHSISLYQSTVSMEKMEAIVRHATELGVSRILLFRSERSQIDFKNKIQNKIDRLTRIATDATRQSNRIFSPKIEYINDICIYPENSIYLLANPNSNNSLLSLIKDSNELKKNKHINILIGPEGGFSSSEINNYISKGAVSVSLGSYVLRTETAGLVALAQLQDFVIKNQI